ncbi:MAG: helix-turn-helix transcriptional regulator, partial [Clostridia bacterium]|nr:helix-turn-helix transcriptional regulator [Clostridia bacterium]
ENQGWTQAALAKQLNVTRSCVNAWELGISVPSTQYLVELAILFKVSSDYLLGLESSATINVTGLSQEDVGLVHQVITHLRNKNK